MTLRLVPLLLAWFVVACTFPRTVVVRDAGSPCRYADATVVADPQGMPVPRGIGAACTAPGECDSNLCVDRHCSALCQTRCDCPPSSNWSCGLLPSAGNACLCTPGGREVCDSVDNDCDGIVDNGIDCAPRSCPDPAERGCGLVGIAGGTFAMGQAGMRLFNGEPVQTSITAGPFSLDAHEVTVARFRRFWDAGHPMPVDPIVFPGNQSVSLSGITRRPFVASSFGCNWSDAPGRRELEPVTCADWTTAMAFCAWDGGRLPTDAEWEYAARGRSVDGLSPGRSFPWGSDPPSSVLGTCALAQYNLCSGEGRTAPGTLMVGSFAPSGGLYDLCGNAWEWVADFFEPYTYAPCWGGTPRTDPFCYADASVGSTAHVLRGGAFYNDQSNMFSATRNVCSNDPTQVGMYLPGFRCAR